MSAQTTLAIQSVKARKHQKPVRVIAAREALDRVQEALQQAEEEERRNGKSMPSDVQEFS